MPTSHKATAHVLIDTSVAVAVVVEDHEGHDSAVRAIHGRSAGLAGHAAFETFSVLTRLPVPARRPAPVVARLLAGNFPDSRFLSPDAAGALLARLTHLRVAGGAVYDALVGATAIEHELLLLSRDRRALATYQALGVEVEVVP